MGSFLVFRVTKQNVQINRDPDFLGKIDVDEVIFSIPLPGDPTAADYFITELKQLLLPVLRKEKPIGLWSAGARMIQILEKTVTFTTHPDPQGIEFRVKVPLTQSIREQFLSALVSLPESL